MDVVRVGVIGVGKMGERHCRVYSNLRDTTFVGLADLDESRAREIASLYGTEYFASHRDLFREVDAVTIATTTPAHFALAMDALDAGIEVLVEKPLTQTVEQGEQLVAAARERKRVVQMGHIERFNPAYVELKNVIENFAESGMRLIGINLRRLSPFDTSNVDVDVVKDLMIHDLDLVSDLCGRSLEDVRAWGRSTTTESVDHAVANLSFRGGPVAQLTASRITEQKVRSVEVTVDGAYIEADLLGKTLTIHRRTLPKYDKAKYQQESIIERIHVPMDEPLVLEQRHFVECVQHGRPSRVPATDGLYALKLAQEIADQVADWSSRSAPPGGLDRRLAANE